MDLWRKLLILLLLYCVQGIPYGFQSRFLPMYLRKEGLSLTYLGFMKLLYIPWIIKTVWAPFVDTLGSKLLWLQSSISVLMATCFIFSIISINNSYILLIGLLVMNLAASIQDIAVDAVAITTLSKEDLGIGNVAQVVGYKFGAVIGGGLLIALYQFFSWSSMFLLLVLIYGFALTVISLSSILRELKGPSKKIHKGLNIKTYWRSLKSISDVPGTHKIAAFLLTYKLCEVGCLNMLPLYLIDKGETIALVGFWTGIVGQCASVGGSAVGGWLLKWHRSTLSTLKFYCCLRIPFMMLLVVLVYMDMDMYFSINTVLYFLMNILLFISGIVTTVTFTLMMESSQKAREGIQATHFTTLSTLEVLGKLAFGIVFGIISDNLGYSNSFFGCVLLSFLSVFLLTRLDAPAHERCI